MRGRRFLNNDAAMSAMISGAQNSLRLKKNPTATAMAAAATILRAAILRRTLSNSPTTPNRTVCIARRFAGNRANPAGNTDAKPARANI